jgi:hypothetical protein
VSILAGVLYQIDVSEFAVKEVPYQARTRAVRRARGYEGLVSTVNVARIERSVERRRIFIAVVGEARICCRLTEGMRDDFSMMIVLELQLPWLLEILDPNP